MDLESFGEMDFTINEMQEMQKLLQEKYKQDTVIMRKWVRNWTKKEGESARLLSMRVMRRRKSSIPVAGSKRSSDASLFCYYHIL